MSNSTRAAPPPIPAQPGVALAKMDRVQDAIDQFEQIKAQTAQHLG